MSEGRQAAGLVDLSQASFVPKDRFMGSCVGELVWCHQVTSRGPVRTSCPPVYVPVDHHEVSELAADVLLFL